ncbi:MAG: glycoside hydrolase family 97 N-terminal domain-containing protein, partial [Balneolales bacterium]|nr:glycoside hydrolase family 97 N-terminal domain-containing protein [Balneolales bacterium]
MKHILTLVCLLVMVAMLGCSNSSDTMIYSPDKKTSIEFTLRADGTPTYLVKHKGAILIDSSSLGFEFKNQPAMTEGFEVTGTSKTTGFSETWEMPWGEQRYVLNEYNEFVVILREKEVPNREMEVIFRA